MGSLLYDQTVRVEFDDRLLAHLQVVIGSKLRRGEAFYFTWRNEASEGDGRTTIWLHPRTALVFKYFGSRHPRLNGAWIDALAETANSLGGMQIVPEPLIDATGPHEVV